MELPLYFVRDSASRVAHHWDYSQDRPWRALCGHRYSGEIRWEGRTRPSRVCRNCQDLLSQYAETWWRQSATQLASRVRELEDAKENTDARIRKLLLKIDNQRKTLHRLQAARSTQRTPAPKKPRDQKTQFDPSLMQPGTSGKRMRPARAGNRFHVVSGGAPGLGNHR